MTIGHVQNPMIGNRDAMGVACQIVQHMLGAAKRSLGVDDPLLGKDLAQKVSEASDSGQFLERAMEL